LDDENVPKTIEKFNAKWREVGRLKIRWREVGSNF
jgi:hypothetical protein